MIFSERLNSWYSKFQKYKVKYKDGFFHLSNLANSPRTMVESFDKMTFVKHNREKTLMTSKTIFLNVQMYYAELQKGLWIMVSDMKFKRNTVMHNIFDETMPVKYNFINLHYNQKSFTSKSLNCCKAPESAFFQRKKRPPCSIIKFAFIPALKFLLNLYLVLR